LLRNAYLDVTFFLSQLSPSTDSPIALLNALFFACPLQSCAARLPKVFATLASHCLPDKAWCSAGEHPAIGKEFGDLTELISNGPGIGYFDIILGKGTVH
jgi:hypothetical protein